MLNLSSWTNYSLDIVHFTYLKSKKGMMLKKSRNLAGADGVLTLAAQRMTGCRQATSILTADERKKPDSLEGARVMHQLINTFYFIAFFARVNLKVLLSVLLVALVILSILLHGLYTPTHLSVPVQYADSDPWNG